MTTTLPYVIDEPDTIYDDGSDERTTREMRAYRPRYVLLSRLTDHCGSHREDGWAMRIDLSDGGSLYVQIGRRKLEQGPDAVYLGECDKVHVWVTEQGKR